MALETRTALDATTTTTTEIIGSGRIGSLLAEAGDCVVLGRQDSIDPNNVGNPILIATRNDALAGIVQACPDQRKGDLVFLQNGYLDDFMVSQPGISTDTVTQALLYLSVTAKSVPPVDGITRVNPEGLTAATGKHAQALADRLAKLGLKCRVVSSDEYRPAMFEKLIWIATYMLVGTAKGCSSVGQAGAEHGTLVEQVVNELVTAVSQAEQITFPPGTMTRLSAYTDVVSNFPCAVKEFEWRNEYFYKLKSPSSSPSTTTTLACPIHNQLLQECAQQGKLSFELPPL
ncbi:hypothetical protein ACA910_019193 [Epithemia clementina (nom. ined.)]